MCGKMKVLIDGIKVQDAFCRTISFTVFSAYMGLVYPKSEK